MSSSFLALLFFFFNDTATTEIYTLSLHDALPICGDATRALLHATSRIRGWRDWLHDHSRYAREHLNLAHVGGDAQGVILIGRRARLGPEDAQRRRDLEAEHKVAIHTYDWLVDGAPETQTRPHGR